MNTMTILFIVTSQALLGNTGEPTGVWLEELTTPYYMFKEAGYAVEIASVQGGEIPIDPRSLSDEDKPKSVVEYEGDEDLQKSLQNSVAANQVDPSRYAAVFFPGGHGTMFDFPDNGTLAGVINDVLARDGLIGAVCHGPAALVGVNGPDGAPIVKGKKISAFTNAEEDAVGLTEEMPFPLETRLRDLGAEIIKADNFEPQAVRDGNLVTGQNPPSSPEVARLMIEALGEK